MKHKHLPIVLDIERASFPRGRQWKKTDFLKQLARRDVVGLVAESRRVGAVAGFLVLEIATPPMGGQCRLINLAVHPLARRHKVGSQLMEMVKQRFFKRQIVAEIPEYNLLAQQFFAAHGFRAVAGFGGSLYTFALPLPAEASVG